MHRAFAGYFHSSTASGEPLGRNGLASGRNRRFRPAHWTLMGLLTLLQPRARAENALSYKYQDYQESDGRISVRVNSALAQADLGLATQLKVEGIMDSIAGATPTGQAPSTPGGQVPLSHMEDERKAWTADLTHQFQRVSLSAGYAQSRESDYHSKGWSLNTLTDFNQKNTTLLFGYARSDDEVQMLEFWKDKQTYDVIAGITQLLNARTSASFNLTYGHASGYLSDPYKLIQKHVEILPGVVLLRTFAENRPDSRERWIALAALNYALPQAHAAIDASYRFHHDDFGITSHTLALSWFQKIGDKVIVTPTIRYYQQSAADFYYVTLDGTNITPTTLPTGKAPYYSADYRLSDFRAMTYGLKLVWTPNDHWQLDVAYEKYDMEGRDSITSPSAYPEANIVTVGAKFSF